MCLFLGVAAADWLLDPFLFLDCFMVPGTSSAGRHPQDDQKVFFILTDYEVPKS